MMAAQVNQHRFYSGEYENPGELNYICSINNLPSILENGILSHTRAHRLPDISDPSDSEVQMRRSNVYPSNQVREKEGKRPIRLHQYVNLYFQPYNRTLHRFIEEAGVKNVCILRVHSKILDQKEALIADRNASTDSVTFHASRDFTFDPASSKLLHLARSKLANWFLKKNGLQLQEKDADQIRQAELLIPYKIPGNYIKGIYTVDETVKQLVLKHFKSADKITIHPSLFYEDGNEWHELNTIQTPDLSDTGVVTYQTTSSLTASDGEDSLMEPFEE